MECSFEIFEQSLQIRILFWPNLFFVSYRFKLSFNTFELLNCNLHVLNVLKRRDLKLQERVKGASLEK